MEMNQLRYFLSVARNGSMASASEELNVSQPTISLAIKSLESEFGVSLFEKRGRRKELSSAGIYFFEQLEPLMSGLDDLKETMTYVNVDSSPSFTVAIEAVDFATELILCYRSVYPDVEIMQIRPTRKNARSLMMTGRADVCIGLFDDTSYELESELVFSDHLELLVNESHPLAANQSLALKDISGEPFICLRQEYALRQLIDQYFRSAKARPRNMFEVGDAETMYIPIRNGHGITFIPECHHKTTIHNKQNELMVWPPYESLDAVSIPISDVDCTHNIYLTTRRRGEKNAACRAFLEFAKRFAEEAGELGYYPTGNYVHGLDIHPF